MSLKQYLKLKGLTARAFAKLADVHESTISRLLHGRGPTYHTSKLIERATKGVVKL